MAYRQIHKVLLTVFLQNKQTCISSFAEKGELFVPSPSYFDVVYLYPDRQAVVPCRVTVLSAKVTLHREFPAKEIPANGTDIAYDMKRGFVYLQPHSDHQGVVYCKAEAGGKSQISVKYQLLYAEGKRVSYRCLDFSCFQLVSGSYRCSQVWMEIRRHRRLFLTAPFSAPPFLECSTSLSVTLTRHPLTSLSPDSSIIHSGTDSV